MRTSLPNEAWRILETGAPAPVATPLDDDTFLVGHNPVFTFEDYADRSYPGRTDRREELANMLAAENQQFIDLFGPFEPPAPRSRWQKAKAAIGSRLIRIGVALMGDDAPWIG